MRTAIDSDDLSVLAGLDGRADFLLTYADLIDSEALLVHLRGETSHSELVFIDRGLGDPLDLATIADIEPDALGVAGLPEWVAGKRAAGKQWLTGYCDRNDLDAVVAIVRHRIWHFVATLDGTMHVDGWAPLHGPALIQVLGENALGIHADLTVVLEDGWRRGQLEGTDAVLLSYPPNWVTAVSQEMQDNGPLGGSTPADPVAGLAAKAPEWDISSESDGRYVARLRGTTTVLEADNIPYLEARIRQLYPGYIAP